MFRPILRKRDQVTNSIVKLSFFLHPKSFPTYKRGAPKAPTILFSNLPIR